MIDPGEMVLFGAGGHAAVVADAAVSAGFVLAGVLADRRPDGEGTPPFGGVPWLGDPEDPDSSLADLLSRGARVHAAVGDPAIRRRWLADRLDVAATIVHPSAVVSPSATIGPGVFIGPGAVINARALVETGAIVNSAAVVEHDAWVGAFAHVAPAAVLLGGARVGPDSLVGASSVVLPEIEVGSGSTLAAGAVASTSIPAGVVARGVPARFEDGA